MKFAKIFASIFVLMLVTGCGKPVKQTVPEPPGIVTENPNAPQPPPAPKGMVWTKQGFCVPDGLNADGGPDVIVCRLVGGKQITFYRREK